VPIHPATTNAARQRMPKPIKVSGKFIQFTPDKSLVHGATRNYLWIYLTAKIPVVIMSPTAPGK
jgi:hypothetical protein